AEFTIGEGELMAHDVPLGCAPDEYDDLISGTCSHLPLFKASLEMSCVGEEFYATVHTTRGDFSLKCIFSSIYKGKYLHGVIFRL
ncbi:hypothetical protein LE032_21740, partial [Escherichia coli]|nr:hypothetical protein [Escherichia coli]